MKIHYSEDFDKDLKKLKKKHSNQELSVLEKIKLHVITCSNFRELEHNLVSKMYGFERLKYSLNNYYSFNLNKHGGKIRLIVKKDENDIEIIIFDRISLDHYEDLK